MEFKDHFSRQADIYLKARPTYPENLFEYLSSISPTRELCWDCATGNGQAAISLAKYFNKVIATDGSERQIYHAIVTQNVEYRIATAEESGLEDSSIGLITVATAAHWFNHDLFYREAIRVARPDGILAVWTYSEATISPEIDELMEWFMYEYLYDYWPDGRWYVRNKYQTLPFPFEPVQTPHFFCWMKWSKQQWLNYVMSWSSYTNYAAKHKSDPIGILLPKLNSLWNEGEVKEVMWPLHLKCARLNTGSLNKP